MDVKKITCNLIMSLSFEKENLLIFKWMCPLVVVGVQRGWRGLHFLGRKETNMTIMFSLFYENCLTEINVSS